MVYYSFAKKERMEGRKEGKKTENEAIPSNM